MAQFKDEAGGAKTFVAVKEAEGKPILGYYSLALAALAYADTPDLMRRGLARHDVPGFRLARLATDLKLRGQGLGGQLLAAAARRCLRVAAEVGGVILIIDAKSERAAAWYASYDAMPLADKPLTLVMAEHARGVAENLTEVVDPASLEGTRRLSDSEGDRLQKPTIIRPGDY